MDIGNLIEMGVIPEVEDLTKPVKCWVNSIQDNITHNPNDTIEDILEKVYNVGKERGIREGERKRSREFRDLIDDAF